MAAHMKNNENNPADQSPADKLNTGQAVRKLRQEDDSQQTAHNLAPTDCEPRNQQPKTARAVRLIDLTLAKDDRCDQADDELGGDLQFKRKACGNACCDQKEDNIQHRINKLREAGQISAIEPEATNSLYRRNTIQPTIVSRWVASTMQLHLYIRLLSTLLVVVLNGRDRCHQMVRMGLTARPTSLRRTGDLACRSREEINSPARRCYRPSTIQKQPSIMAWHKGWRKSVGGG